MEPHRQLSTEPSLLTGEAPEPIEPSARATRKPYTAPRVTRHGSIVTQTEKLVDSTSGFDF